MQPLSIILSGLWPWARSSQASCIAKPGGHYLGVHDRRCTKNLYNPGLPPSLRRYLCDRFRPCRSLGPGCMTNSQATPSPTRSSVTLMRTRQALQNRPREYAGHETGGGVSHERSLPDDTILCVGFSTFLLRLPTASVALDSEWVKLSILIWPAPSGNNFLIH